MKHIPNILTTLRMILIPSFIYIYLYRPDLVQWPLVIFIVASLTDVLDGYLARRYHVESVIGTVLDPLADKMMLIAVLTCLWVDEKVHGVVIVIILLKELFLIISGSILYFKKDRVVIPSNILGKLATVIFSVTIVLLLWGIPSVLGNLLILAALSMKFVALSGYVQFYMKTHSKKARNA